MPRRWKFVVIGLAVWSAHQCDALTLLYRRVKKLENRLEAWEQASDA